MATPLARFVPANVWAKAPSRTGGTGPKDPWTGRGPGQPAIERMAKFAKLSLANSGSATTDMAGRTAPAPAHLVGRFPTMAWTAAAGIITADDWTFSTSRHHMLARSDARLGQGLRPPLAIVTLERHKGLSDPACKKGSGRLARPPRAWIRPTGSASQSSNLADWLGLVQSSKLVYRLGLVQSSRLVDWLGLQGLAGIE